MAKLRRAPVVQSRMPETLLERFAQFFRALDRVRGRRPVDNQQSATSGSRLHGTGRMSP